MIKKLNKKILYTSFVLVFIGFLIFFSVVLKNLNDPKFFTTIFLNQTIAIFLGLMIMLIIANSKKISKTFFRHNSSYILILATFFQLLVFIPGLGVSYKGGSRWINLGFFNFQPSEFFKIAVILFFSAVTVTLGKKITHPKKYLLLLSSFVIPIFLFYFLIHDWGTMATILFALGIILFISKTKISHILLSLIFGITFSLTTIWFFVPYGQERVQNFINPATADNLNSFYQNHQMIMTIGSGQLFGRGFGGSLQKFSGLLPELMGDSIFAVYSEETGFIGSTILILLFLLLFYYILKAAKKTKAPFEKNVIVGLAILIIFPTFFNIAATMSLVPLSGIPIPFVSKGGTATLSAFISLGIILFYTRKKR